LKGAKKLWRLTAIGMEDEDHKSERDVEMIETKKEKMIRRAMTDFEHPKLEENKQSSLNVQDRPQDGWRDGLEDGLEVGKDETTLTSQVAAERKGMVLRITLGGWQRQHRRSLFNRSSLRPAVSRRQVVILVVFGLDGSAKLTTFCIALVARLVAGCKCVIARSNRFMCPHCKTTARPDNETSKAVVDFSDMS
jgi:hypothetical protein